MTYLNKKESVLTADRIIKALHSEVRVNHVCSREHIKWETYK